MVCPECRAEHMDGATECRDCLVPLVDALPAGAPPPRARRFALAGYSRILAVLALAMGAIVLTGLLLDIAFLTGHFSEDAYDSALMHLIEAGTFLMLGPISAGTALAARDAAPSDRGRGLLRAAAYTGLVGAAGLIVFFLVGVNALGSVASLAVAAAMVLLAVGFLRARVVPALLAWLLLASVVLMAGPSVEAYTLGMVLFVVAEGALGLFWITLGVFCMPRRNASVGRSGSPSTLLTRRSS
jgi:hypothetical protein